MGRLTIDRVRRFNKVPEITLKGGTVLKAGDSVYIRPNGATDREVLAGDVYWKFRVEECRESGGGDQALIGTWWLNKNDAAARQQYKSDRDMVEAMGEHELVLSLWRDAVGVECVEDKLSMPLFVDGEMAPVLCDGDDYYYRFIEQRSGLSAGVGVSPCEVCGKHYQPDFDQEIYCGRCRSWLHIECCAPSQGTYSLAGHNGLAEQLVNAPLIRGYWGSVLAGGALGGTCRMMEGIAGRLTCQEEVDGEEYEGIFKILSGIDKVLCPKCEHVIGGLGVPISQDI